MLAAVYCGCKQKKKNRNEQSKYLSNKKKCIKKNKIKITTGTPRIRFVKFGECDKINWSCMAPGFGRTTTMRHILLYHRIKFLIYTPKASEHRKWKSIFNRHEYYG